MNYSSIRLPTKLQKRYAQIRERKKGPVEG